MTENGNNLYFLDKPEISDLTKMFDLMDLVFSQDSEPHDFRNLLPKLYHNTQQCADDHYIVRAGDRIVASIGSFPVEIQMGGHTLKAEGIGGVATHKRETGKGHMRNIMHAVNDHYQNDGVQLSYLGGMRKRYQYHGYEPSGICYSFYVTKSNVKEISATAKAITLTIKEIARDDAALLAYTKKLLRRNPLYYLRNDERLYDILCSWYSKPYAALDSNGDPVAYLVADKWNGVKEIYAENDDIFEATLAAWANERGDFGIDMPPWCISYINRLSMISEGMHISGCGSWKIMDWVSVISGLLSVKSTYQPLMEGQANIGIQNYGTLSILAKGGSATCSLTECKPDVDCDSFTALRLMCGPLPPQMVTELPPAIAVQLMNWFPLPLFTSRPDGV